MMVLMVLAFLLALVLILAGITYSMAFYAPPRQRGKKMKLPGGEQYERVKEITHALAREMEALPYERVWITAMDGTKLFARYYHLSDGAPLQIQFHGYRGSSIRDFCGGHKLARQSGHNTLVVDQRAHGESGGSTITFGVRERYDCLCWANYACERFGGEIPIFLSGVSMGAATVLMASELELPGNVLGIIADCPYSSPEKIIRKVCRDMHFPPEAAFPFIRLGGRLFGGFDIASAGAMDAVRHAKLPILLLHGEDDRFVPCGMSPEIRAANPEMIRCETFPDAGHGLSYVVDPVRYSHLVNEFIDMCLAKRS